MIARITKQVNVLEFEIFLHASYNISYVTQAKKETGKKLNGHNFDQNNVNFFQNYKISFLRPIKLSCHTSSLTGTYIVTIKVSVHDF